MALRVRPANRDIPRGSDGSLPECWLLVITSGKKKGRHSSPATVLRMLREHDEQITT